MNNKKTLLDNKIFNSQIKSPRVGLKEMIIGYFLGPAGAFLLNAIFSSYLNTYYTDVLGISGTFLYLMPLFSAIVVAITNFLFGIIIERTRTSRGKGRPYLILGAILLAITGICLVFIPSNIPEVAKLIWIAISYNLYYAFGFAIYSNAHNLMIPLSTRNSQKRATLSTFTNMSSMFMTGVIGGFVFPSLIMSNIGVSQNLWILVFSICSILAFPFTMLEYYFTKERITEENILLGLVEDRIPLKNQIKAVFKDRYWLLMMTYFILFYLGSCLRNASMNYYCNWVIGKEYSDGITMTLLNIIGGIPMAVGLLFIGPLQKKMSKRTLILSGFILYAIGSVITFCVPYIWKEQQNQYVIRIIVVLIGQFIKNIGSVPCVYIILALFSDVLDHVEWRSGFRCDGFSMSLYTIIFTIFPMISNAVLNMGITAIGYKVPLSAGSLEDLAAIENAYQGQIQTIKENADGTFTIALNQSEGIVNFFNFTMIGIEIITATLIIIVLFFLTVEKNIKKENEEILLRKKLLVESRGQVWIDPDTRARLDQERVEREEEEDYLKQLKIRCEKKGLSYEEEKQKYLEKCSKKKKIK